MSFPLIEVENLSKSVFCDRSMVSLLEDVSFFVYSGDIFGIIGFSGAGKSTLLRCIASFTNISSGRITINHSNNKVDSWNRIGYVFQDFRLFFGKTVLGNIAYPLIVQGWKKNKALEEANRLLDLVGLNHKRHSYPASLSGGEKQKIALARAMVNSPAILICDEVTSALDTQSKEDILKILSHINSQMGITIIFVSHEMSSVKKLCNRIMVLDRGKKIEENFTEDLFLFPQNSLTKNLLGRCDLVSLNYYLSFFNDKDNTEILRLGFRKDNAFSPIIGDLVKNTPVTVNILSGDIDLLCCSPVGFLVVAITGSENTRMDFKKSLISANVVICNSI